MAAGCQVRTAASDWRALLFTGPVLPQTPTVAVAGMNVALAVCAVDIDTTHADVPVQLPDQPANVHPTVAVEVSVRVVPGI